MSELEAEPLLRTDANTSSESRFDGPPTQKVLTRRALDDDVFTETATTGRRIGWTSAYILVISRVIGSGIFAMPGTIVQNVGSLGLALSLWLIGAFVAWASLPLTWNMVACCHVREE